MDWSLLLTNITLFTGTFCLGGISILYYQRRTFILKVVLLFLFSIMLICLGFWLQLASVRLSKDLPAWEDAFLILTSFIYLTGLVLNVAVVPYLIAGLTSLSIEPPSLYVNIVDIFREGPTLINIVVTKLPLSILN